MPQDKKDAAPAVPQSSDNASNDAQAPAPSAGGNASAEIEFLSQPEGSDRDEAAEIVFVSDSDGLSSSDAGESQGAGESHDAAAGGTDQPVAAEGVVERDASMRYLQAYAFVLENPHWAHNVILLSTLQLIPLLGGAVLWGYAYENVEALHRKPRWTYPDFDVARFGDYLSRSIWPMLILLILAPPGYFATYAALVLTVVTLMLAFSGLDYALLTVSIVLPLVLIAGVLILLAGAMLLRVMLMRAALAQNFGEAFRVRWLADYFRRVWVELLLATLFAAVTSFAICALGLALFLVGIYPAVTLCCLASAHLDYQLYQLYLSRGGKPIELKPPPACFAGLWD